MFQTLALNYRKFDAYRPAVLRYAASSGSLLVSNLAQLATFSILARSLGAEGFGHYVSFIAVTNIAVYVCGLGASECLVRRVAQDRTTFPALYGHNLILIAGTGILLVALGMLVLPHLFQGFADGGDGLLVIFLLLVTNVVLVRLIMLNEAASFGFLRFSEANHSVLWFALARLGAVVLACLVFRAKTVEEWAVWQFACHLLLALIYGCRMFSFGRPQLHLAIEELKLGLFFSTPFIFRAIRQNADLALLGLLATPEIVASYGIARRITDSSYMAIEALNRIMYPGLARAAAEGTHHAIRRSRQLLPAALALGAVTSFTIFLAAPWLPILFGQEYVSLSTFCRLASGYILLVAAWTIAIESLGAAGQHRWRAWVLNVCNGGGAVVIAAATWFCPPWGAFVGNYATEIAIVAAAWFILLRQAQHGRNVGAEADQRFDKIPADG